MSLFKILKGDSSRISTDITPFHDGWCYYTEDDGGFYIDSLTEDGKQKRTRINKSDTYIEKTLTTDGWDNGVQTLTSSEITADKNGHICLPYSATDEQIEATKNADIRVCEQGDGTLTVKAYGDIPQIDIPTSIILLP